MEISEYEKIKDALLLIIGNAVMQDGYEEHGEFNDKLYSETAVNDILELLAGNIVNLDKYIS